MKYLPFETQMQEQTFGLTGRNCCCCSVAQSCLILCNFTDCSTPVFPAVHHLPELAQTHVHWVRDAIQPSKPLPSPSPPALIFPSIRVFPSELTLRIMYPEYWSFSFGIGPSNECLGLIFFRIVRFHPPCCPREFQEFSAASQFESINSLALSLLYGPTLVSICEYSMDLCQQSDISAF